MRPNLALPLIALLALAPAAHAHDEADGTATMRSSPEAARASYDVQFLDTMAQHHRDGIEMFQMAADKAKSQQLRKKAQQMIDDQRKEIPELKSMRDDVQLDAPEAINMGMPGMKPMDMSKLEAASGKDFDRHFIDMTIEHHQGAIAMAKSELKSGKSQAVKDKAQQIIDKQGKEIAELKRLRGPKE